MRRKQWTNRELRVRRAVRLVGEDLIHQAARRAGGRYGGRDFQAEAGGVALDLGEDILRDERARALACWVLSLTTNAAELRRALRDLETDRERRAAGMAAEAGDPPAEWWSIVAALSELEGADDAV